jgi:hypothetical protein
MGSGVGVDGFFFDDNWNQNGPAEANGWDTATGLQRGSQEVLDITAGWTQTVLAATAAVQKAGGFTWAQLNCDQGEYPPSSSYSQQICGAQFETSGYFGNPQRASTVSKAKAQCAAWLRGACRVGSTLPKVPLLYKPTMPDVVTPSFELPAGIQDVAMFMLVRGPYAWFGSTEWDCFAPWENTRPSVLPKELRMDYGEPKDAICSETAVGSGVFVRQWTKAHVSMDCNTFEATIAEM